MDIEEREPVELDHALDELARAQDHVIKLVEDGGLDGYDVAGFVGFLQGFERVRNRSVLVDHRAIRDAQVRRLPEALSQSGMVDVLAWQLRLSRADAARRVRAADAVGERVSMTGERLAPLRPALAAAQREGVASPEQVDLCVRALAGVDRRGFDPADVDAADALLARFTATFAPKELRRLAEQVVEHIDPDGTRPADELNADRRHVDLRKSRDGEAWTLRGRLTGAVGAKLAAVLGPLAAPRVESVTLDDGSVVAQPDPRHRGQRVHDALEEACDRLLRSATLPDSGGTPATVIVTITEEALRTRRGCGRTSDGTRLSADAVVGLADSADVYYARVDAFGVVLELGRTRRLASCGQTVALIARDGGCSFPGCARPPEWCERHHITAWVDGGRTDVSNLTLLCAYHHHHFAAHGWTCLMTDGLPAWIPPHWIDPQQRPLLNARIAARQQGPGLRC